MIIGRAAFFACASIFLTAPAELNAAADPAVPATASFAYRRSHPVIALPAPVIDSVARHERGDGDESASAPIELPAKIGTAPARALSRNGVCDAVVSAARAHDLPVPFFANLIWQESNFRPVAVSPAGAQGIAQFMPRTAAAMGLFNPFEPIQALFTAGKLLRQLVGQFGGNLGLAAAAYNAGPKRVNDWLGKRSALPGETRDYVHTITGRPADQWTPRKLARGPEAELMPARAPCMAVAEAVEAKAKEAHEARIIAKRIQVQEVREAAARRVVKIAARAADKVAHRTVKKDASRVAQDDAPSAKEAKRVAKNVSRVAKADTAEKLRKPAARANVPARRTRYASASAR